MLGGIPAMIVGALQVAVAASSPALSESVVIEAGRHTPFYPPTPALTEVEIPAFAMDAAPVTRQQFQRFVIDNPRWQRGIAPAIFVDESYLQSWSSPTSSGPLLPDLPVTEVSWFAARAYCQAAGGDLPTVYQWEYAADATADAPHGARKDPDTLSRILAWYAQRGAQLASVGQQPPNYWGLHDMHGLIWEWTLDFNNQLISADVRESGEDNLRFCGAGALSAVDVEDYASFMRFAMRSALQASYTTENLGFRCAYPL